MLIKYAHKLKLLKSLIKFRNNITDKRIQIIFFPHVETAKRPISWLSGRPRASKLLKWSCIRYATVSLSPHIVSRRSPGQARSGS